MVQKRKQRMDSCVQGSSCKHTGRCLFPWSLVGPPPSFVYQPSQFLFGWYLLLLLQILYYLEGEDIEKISPTKGPFSYAEGSAHFLIYVKSRTQTVKCYWPHSGWIFLPQLAWVRKSPTAMSAGQPDLDSSSLRVPSQAILHCVKLTIKNHTYKEFVLDHWGCTILPWIETEIKPP